MHLSKMIIYIYYYNIIQDYNQIISSNCNHYNHDDKLNSKNERSAYNTYNKDDKRVCKWEES